MLQNDSPHADLRTFTLYFYATIGFILLFSLIIPIAFGCDTGGSGTDPDPQNTKISDEDIRGTWLKVTEEGDVDTAVFSENQLRAPCAEDGAGDYCVENGRIIVGDTVVAEYEIADDTLYIEALLAIEPDGIIDRESATKYVKLVTEPDDTGNTNPPVTNGEMDPVGKDIPVGLAMTYTDSFYTAGMELIEAAWDTFSMGIPPERTSFEKDFQHDVCLTYDYYIDRTEVTCGAFCEAMNYAIDEGYVDLTFKKLYDEDVYLVVNSYGEEQNLLNIGDEGKLIGYSSLSGHLVSLFNSRYPVVFMSWYGAAFYCNMLSEQRGLEKVYDIEDWSIDYRANGYRLPTNAEHEYATRSGSQTLNFWGDNWSIHDRYLVDISESGGVVPVGSKYSNDFGLWDMVGNVYEICNDFYAHNYYKNSPFYNPVGPEESFLTVENTPGESSIPKLRVIRGGGMGRLPNPDGTRENRRLLCSTETVFV